MNEKLASSCKVIHEEKSDTTLPDSETPSSVPQTRAKHNSAPETKWGPENQVGLILFTANMTSEILLIPLNFDFG